MSSKNLNEPLAENLDNPPVPEQNENYEELLKDLNLPFKTTGYYLQIGEITQVQGWILHISVIISQTPALLKLIIPFLAEAKVPFKMAAEKYHALQLLNGAYGHINLGKIVSIYPGNDVEALQLAKELIALTTPYKGPDIPTDIHLGGTVYTRYGSFNPVLKQQADGTVAKFIYNPQGQLIPDSYSIPFNLPQDISWPFSSFKSPDVPARKKIMNDKIKPVSIIKSDVKGSVIKGLYLKSWLKTSHCVVKEGKKCMFGDDHGRDVQDRLEWQLQLHQELSGELPIPKILDHFYEEGDFYIAMEYIQGVSLEDTVLSVFQLEAWRDLPQKSQLLLLDYLLQVIQILKVMHAKGYVHRDITPYNFLVDKNNRLFMIDLELVYSTLLKKPNPPFTLGTIGFMSPEQEKASIPTVKEDIYGVGATMMALFTGLSPASINVASERNLQQTLCYLMGDNDLVPLITRCLEKEPQKRPELITIQKSIADYHNHLSQKPPKKALPLYSRLDNDQIKTIIEKAVNGLVCQKMIDVNGVWFSQATPGNSRIANIQAAYCNATGMYEGIAGIFYVLFALKKAGFGIEQTLKQCSANMEYINKNGFLQLSAMPAGLFSGSAGWALMVTAGAQSGLLNMSENFIQACLENKSLGLDLSNGAAGRGIALLQCIPYLPETFIHSKLQYLTNLLLQAQEQDGSWITNLPGQKTLKLTGLAGGVSGIIWFLLAVYEKFSDESIKIAIVNGLKWLQKQAVKKENSYCWFTSSLKNEMDPWLISGITGIALTFTRAYEVLQNSDYKVLAEGALFNFPPHPTYRNLSQANGVAGLGETYLEAARVFGSQQWQDRADWIAGSLSHLTLPFMDNSCYWAVNGLHSTADLMTGNSGVIHFLARYLFPQNIGMPLIGK